MAAVVDLVVKEMVEVVMLIEIKKALVVNDY